MDIIQNLSFLSVPSLKKSDCERIATILDEVHSPLIEIDGGEAHSTPRSGYKGLTIVTHELTFTHSSLTSGGKKQCQWLKVLARSDERAKATLRNPIKEAIRLRGLTSPRA